MASDALASALGIAYAVFLLAGFYVYISLIRQINARTPSFSPVVTSTFGLAEAIVAGFLVLFLLFDVLASTSAPTKSLGTRELLANLILFIVVVLILVAFLKLRG